MEIPKLVKDIIITIVAVIIALWLWNLLQTKKESKETTV